MQCEYVALNDLPRADEWTGPLVYMKDNGVIVEHVTGSYIDIEGVRHFSPMWVDGQQAGIDRAALISSDATKS